MKAPAKGNAKVPCVSATFFSNEGLYRFMSSLSKLPKIRKFKEVQVEKACPPILKDLHDRAAEKAFNLRKKGFLTRVSIEDGTVKLYKRKKKEDDWEEVPIDDDN